jgi:hypothetical protein
MQNQGERIVDVFGIESFPTRFTNMKPIRDYDVYAQKTMELKLCTNHLKTL